MAAEAAAESRAESPAGQPVDSPGQLTGFPPEILHAHQRDQLFVRDAIEEFYTAAQSPVGPPSDSACHQTGFPETVQPQQRDELFVRAAIDELRAIAEAGAESPAESPAGQPADSACHQTGFPREILHAQQRDQKFVKAAIEEFAAAAESPASSSPADDSADSPPHLTGLMTTTAAAYAPASLADGTQKRASLLQTEGGPTATASLSPSESEVSVCAFYPDDFVMSCKSETEAAAMLLQPGAITWQDEKGGEGPVAADPTAALLNFQALLHRSLRCPLSGVRFSHKCRPPPFPPSHPPAPPFPGITLCQQASADAPKSEANTDTKNDLSVLTIFAQRWQLAVGICPKQGMTDQYSLHI